MLLISSKWCLQGSLLLSVCRQLTWQQRSVLTHLCSPTHSSLVTRAGVLPITEKRSCFGVADPFYLSFFSNCLSLLPVLLLCSSPEQSDGAGWFTLWLKVMEEVSSPKKLACVDLWKVTLTFPCFLQADLAVEICNVLASKTFTASCADANISPPYSNIWGWSLGTRLKDQGRQGCWCCTIQDQGSQLYQVLTAVNRSEVSVTGGSGQAAHAAGDRRRPAGDRRRN